LSYSGIAQESLSGLKDRVYFIVDSLIKAKPFETKVQVDYSSQLITFYDYIQIDPDNVKPVVKELFDIGERSLPIALSWEDYRFIHYVNLLSVNLLVKSNMYK
jgi:hypothetical protein